MCDSGNWCSERPSAARPLPVGQRFATLPYGLLQTRRGVVLTIIRIMLRVLVFIYPAARAVFAWYLAIALMVVIIFVPLLLAVLAMWLMGN